MNPEQTDTVHSDNADLRAFHEKGDAEALARLFDRTAPKLMLIAMHLTRDSDAAEELLQATFLAVMQSASTFDQTRPVMPWLTGILANRAANMRRSAARSRLVFGGEQIPEPAATDDPADQAATSETIAMVQEAIDSVPESYRHVLMLRLVHGLRAVEIARSIGSSPDTVRSQLRRGMDILRRRLPTSVAVPGIAVALSRECLARVRGRVLAVAAGGGIAVGTWWLSRWAIAAAVFAIVSTTVLVTLREGAAESEPPLEVAGKESDALAGGVPAAQRVPVEETKPEGVTADPSDRWRVVYADDGAPARGVRISATRLGAFYTAEAAAMFVADEDGYVDSSKLAAGAYTLEYGMLGRVLATTGKPALLRIPKGVDVHGSVVDAEGQPVSGAEIWLGNTGFGERGRIVTKSDAEGQFLLSNVPSPRHVMARSEGYAWSARYQVGRLPRSPNTVRIRLTTPARTIYGVVTDPSGRPMSDVLVRASFLTPSLMPDGPSSVIPPPSFVRTNARGEYRIPNLQPETYDVRYRHEGQGFTTMFGKVTLTDGDQRQDVTIAPGWAAYGVVRDAAGTPIENARVEVRPHGPMFTPHATTDAEGRYRIEGINPGKMRILAFAEHHGQGSGEQTGGKGEAHRCDLTVDPGIYLRGRLTDERGQALENWVVEVLGVPGARPARTSENGEFFATNLSGAGPFSIRAGPIYKGPPHLHGKYPAGDLGTLTVRDDQKPTARVVGKILLETGVPPRHTHVSMRTQPSGWVSVAHVDPETGLFAVEACVPGSAKLSFYSGDQWFPVRSMEVPVGETVEIGTFHVPATGSIVARFAMKDGSKMKMMLGVQVVVAQTGVRVPTRQEKGAVRATLRPGDYILTVIGPKVIRQQIPFRIEAGRKLEKKVLLVAGTPVELKPVVDQRDEPPQWVSTEVMDATGAVCFAEGIRAPFVRSSKLGLAPGNYTVRMRDDRGVKVEKKIVVGAERLLVELKLER